MRKLLELILGTFFIWFPIVRRGSSRKNITNNIIGGVSKSSRKIELTRLDGELDDTLFDLIQAGLVEKV